VAAGSAAELIVVPVQLKGRPCYRVTWGLYPSATAAAAAAGTVPAYFRNEGVRPRVITTSEISR
jgi:septal ring-binding cell division protein DamX